MTQVMIFGSNGQDGRCLTELLQKQGIEVVGISRSSGVDLCHSDSIAELLKTHQPSQVYYLAAFHHSSDQKIDSEVTLWDQSIKTHLTAPTLILENIRQICPETRFFYASSSLVFGGASGKLSESTPRDPDSPYGITKAAGMNVCRYYRERYGLFASSGILFNHESEFRAPKFLTKKIVLAVLAIQKGSSERLKLGSLSAQVDWGYARDYVEAMTLILKHETADDFVISSGELHSVRQFVELAFSKAGLDYSKFVDEDPLLLQRVLPSRLGDFSKLRSLTGWTPKTSFDKLIEILLVSEGVQIVRK